MTATYIILDRIKFTMCQDRFAIFFDNTRSISRKIVQYSWVNLSLEPQDFCQTIQQKSRLKFFVNFLGIMQYFLSRPSQKLSDNFSPFLAATVEFYQTKKYPTYSSRPPKIKSPYPENWSSFTLDSYLIY